MTVVQINAVCTGSTGKICLAISDLLTRQGAENYIFYADGKEVGRQMAPECPVSEIDQFILVSTECHGYNRKFTNQGGAGVPTLIGEPVEALFSAYPDQFTVDFVRVYDEVEGE